MNTTLPSERDNLSINSFLISSVINLSKDDLKVIFSVTFMYPSTPFIVRTYSSICLYQEFDLSIESTFIHLMVVFLNGSKDVFDKISVISSIINGFLKSGLSLPYFKIASV